MKLILALPAVALLLSAATRIPSLPQNQVAPAPPPVGAKMWADRTVLYKGEIHRASEETDDMYTTMDRVMEKVEAAAQKQKERLQDLKKH